MRATQSNCWGSTDSGDADQSALGVLEMSDDESILVMWPDPSREYRPPFSPLKRSFDVLHANVEDRAALGACASSDAPTDARSVIAGDRS